MGSTYKKVVPKIKYKIEIKDMEDGVYLFNCKSQNMMFNLIRDYVGEGAKRFVITKLD